MPSEDIKILEFNQYQKSEKEPLIIYAYLECLIERTDGCKNNPENSSATKVNVFHQVFQCLQYCNLKAWKISMICTKKLCESLREHTMERTNLKLLTNKLQKSYKNAENCYIYEEKIKDKTC